MMRRLPKFVDGRFGPADMGPMRHAQSTRSPKDVEWPSRRRDAKGAAARVRAMRVAVAVSILIVALNGCAVFEAPLPEENVSVEPIRVSELLEDGSAVRRASMRLVLDGLDDDARGDSSRAQSRYERALQVDAHNPYAYLAMARHDIDAGNPDRALAYLDRARALLARQGEIPPRVEVQLSGLRGSALYLKSGNDDESMRYLDRANALAPEVWGDGTLSADELR
jgi:tetratricopeptide (TPR) repeat protein